MINIDDVTGENIKKDNSRWTQIPDNLYRLWTTGSSGSGKTNALLNLINHQPGMNKISLYTKDPFEAKHQFLIKSSLKKFRS